MIHSANASTFIGDKFQAPFFQAAKDRNRDKLEECLDHGVHLNAQEPSGGNTALHYLLADGCFCENCTAKLNNCLEMLLHRGADPNMKNFNGKVPIEFAVNNLVPFHLVKLMMEHGATLISESGISNRKLMKKFIRKMPEAICETLDRAVNFKGSVNEDGNKTVQLNWRYIVYNQEAFKDSGHGKWKETEFLYDVVSKGTSEGKRIILTHPLVRAFLRLKAPNYWRPFGYFYCSWITLTLVMYLTFVWTLYNDTCRYDRNSTAVSKEDMAIEEVRVAEDCHIRAFETIIAYIIVVFYLIGPVGLELRKFLTMVPVVWVKQWQNYIFLPASFLVMVTLYPALSLKTDYTLTWQYPAAAIGMLVGSLSIMVQMTPVPFIALYLEMLLKVLLRIVVASIAVSPLVLGFFFSFRILLTRETIGWFQLFTMVVSDSDYEQLMDEDRGDFYEIVAYLFFSAFILLVIIVVLNLLIGLAVSDVDQLKEYAHVTNLGNKVKSYYLLDGVYGEGSNKFLTSNGLLYEFQPLKEKRNKLLPSPLRIELLHLARNSCCQTDTHHSTKNSDKDSASSIVKVKMED